MNRYFSLLENCCLCPRMCGVNRLKGERGYCNCGAGFEISSICIHKGEEPPISGKKGICNIFFYHCNLQCVFCQNHQISDNNVKVSTNLSLDDAVDEITKILNKGINAIGFVSPTHFLPQATAIINTVRDEGYNPVTVWNSNAYELPEMLEVLDDLIDVFLPDFKYSDKELSAKYSDAEDYPAVAEVAIKKMISMKGPRLICDDDGLAVRGMLLRHLVLPSHSDQSTAILKTIANSLSVKMPVSLMSQYHPAHKSGIFDELNKYICAAEYKKVYTAMMDLGLSGWIQQYDSPGNYMPDFNKKHPFGKE